MAQITQNTYTGDGTTVLFPFSFPYLRETDIKVSLDTVETTEYTLANATTVEMNTAPPSGAILRIYRETDDSALIATFYSGSAIRANDLNADFEQVLFISQETKTFAENTDASSIAETAQLALDTSAAALAVATNAEDTANAIDGKAQLALDQSTQAVNDVQSAVDAAEAATEAADNANQTAALSLLRTGGNLTGGVTQTEREIEESGWSLLSSNFWRVGAITIPNPTNFVVGQSGLIRCTAAPLGWGSTFKFAGGTPPDVTVFPSIIPFYVQADGEILLGNAVGVTV